MTEQKPRRKRHQRQDPPPPIRMTERDQRVLEAVYHYRVLSQSQLQRLLFTHQNRNVAQRRLMLLYHNGYLERRFLLRVGGMVVSPILYLLDKSGSEYLIRNCGYDEVRWKASDNKVGGDYLEHLLAINTFRIEVTLACQQLGYSLLEWRDDTTLKEHYDRVFIAGTPKAVAVIPDGYFVIETPRGKTHFFLELDRGTMESKRFKQKILAYLAYDKTGQSERRFGTTKYRVLTVTESKARSDNLRRVTEETEGKSRFWFATLNELTAMNVLTEPIWNVAGRQDKAVLINYNQ